MPTDATLRPLLDQASDRSLALFLIQEYTQATADEMEVELEAIRPYIPDYDDFPGRYAPPGLFLVAEVAGQPAACVGLAPLDAERMEMNRLWVRPEFRQLGLAKTLVQACLAAAAQRGYAAVALEVLPTREAAIRLYRQLGFEDVAPLHDYDFPMVALQRRVQDNADLSPAERL